MNNDYHTIALSRIMSYLLFVCMCSVSLCHGIRVVMGQFDELSHQACYVRFS